MHSLNKNVNCFFSMIVAMAKSALGKTVFDSGKMFSGLRPTWRNKSKSGELRYLSYAATPKTNAGLMVIKTASC